MNVEIITSEFINFLVTESVYNMQSKVPMPNKLELVRVTEENEKSQSFDAVDYDQDLKKSGLECSTFNFIKDYLCCTIRIC